MKFPVINALYRAIRYRIRKFFGIFGPRPVFDLYEPEAILPARGSQESACLDLYVNEGGNIEPGKILVLGTGLRCRFLPGWVALFQDRSSLAVAGCHVVAGVVDSDYRGEWKIALTNLTPHAIVINRGDRVAQVRFQRTWMRRPRRGKVIQDTIRADGGFGSTGK